MRALRLMREALLYLLGSGVGVVALLTCVRELLRPPGGTGLWGGAVPITEHKWPWVLVLALLLVMLWLVARVVGGVRGVMQGALVAGLRTVFWWAAAALGLFVGVAVHGFLTHPIAALNWTFACGYLLSMLALLLLSAAAQRRLSGPAV